MPGGSYGTAHPFAGLRRVPSSAKAKRAQLQANRARRHAAGADDVDGASGAGSPRAADDCASAVAARAPAASAVASVIDRPVRIRLLPATSTAVVVVVAAAAAAASSAAAPSRQPRGRATPRDAAAARSRAETAAMLPVASVDVPRAEPRRETEAARARLRALRALSLALAETVALASAKRPPPIAATNGVWLALLPQVVGAVRSATADAEAEVAMMAMTTPPSPSPTAATATTTAATAASDDDAYADAAAAARRLGDALFSLAQQALQSGPLRCSKPAAFRRLARAGARADEPAVRRAALRCITMSADFQKPSCAACV
jgi:hypothetical protein